MVHVGVWLEILMETLSQRDDKLLNALHKRGPNCSTTQKVDDWGGIRIAILNGVKCEATRTFLKYTIAKSVNVHRRVNLFVFWIEISKDARSFTMSLIGIDSRILIYSQNKLTALFGGDQRQRT